MSTDQILSCFSSSYVEARHKFLAACAERSLEGDSRLIPNARGVSGEELYADIALIGSKDAPKALLILSGTHGVEGYCGSGAQIAMLEQGLFDALPHDLCVIMIHAMNPYGFSHDRRVTEDNVDLNRNFLDFNRTDLPGAEYARIHEHILPSDWDGEGRANANKQLAEFIKTHGPTAFQAAVSSGQYLHPDGIFFGGQKPTWSNGMLHAVLADYLADKSVVATVDFHTGLGPHGYGELITMGTEAEKRRAFEWYGDGVTDPEAGTSTSAALDGTVADGIVEQLKDATHCFIAIEFGTYDINEVLTALRGDNWLYHKGDVGSPLGSQIKADIRRAFYPDTDEWKQSVWSRSEAVIGLALKGIDQL